MKLNYSVIKRILTTMQEKESHFISTLTLLEETKPEFQNIDESDYMDLIYGHLHLLKDNGLIQQLSVNSTLGIEYGYQGKMLISECFIRLTSKGYDFIKVLKHKNIIEKLKNYTLSEGLKITDAMLINLVNNCINTFMQ